MTEENRPFRHTSSSLGKHMATMFLATSNHGNIFFSGVCRKLFWDEGHEDTVPNVWLSVGSGSNNNSLSSI